ncbi:RidA family protein [Loktanella sp. SALINAS62]|uniref:RidA family protein n=1 Tax=Loktanella sp. SALINAS62 TaxID=2706124 RepID=UPI001B8C3C17|nr:RidA family protein [Loktanella sp. SALINAS62]MBS1301414.1 RidA family protein [Loktanella sp. SALINAS62]
MSGIERRLADLGLALPSTCPPRASFVKARTWNGLLMLSGQICEWNGEPRWFGPVTDASDMEETRKAAQMCALNLLFCAKEALGSLDRIDAILRLGGFVNAAPGFGAGPAVIDGASDLFIALFGDAGRHARTAVCVSSLPVNAAVEVDAMIAYT